MAADATDPILNLSEVARNDIAHLAKNRGKLKQVATAIADLRLGMGLSDAARAVVEASGIPPQDAVRIFWTIQNLQRLRTRRDQDAAEVLEAITTSLEGESSEEWKKENLEGWKEATGALTELLDIVQRDHPLAVARKAEQLGSEHQNLFMHARILTDLRPVFNAAGDKIHESLVIQTLLIDYYDGTEPRRLALAVDAPDVAQLRRLCERAEVKASALKESLTDVPWPTVIVGQDEDS